MGPEPPLGGRDRPRRGAVRGGARRSRRGADRHDPGRRQRRRRAHGLDHLRGRRGRRRHGARGAHRSRARASRSTTPSPSSDPMCWSTSRFRQPRSRTSAARWRPACTSSSARPASICDEIRGLEGANVFVAPNFAIGAVLLMQFAAQAAKHMQSRRDHRAAPRSQARQAQRHRGPHGRADARGGAREAGCRRSIRCACRAWSPTRR